VKEPPLSACQKFNRFWGIPPACGQPVKNLTPQKLEAMLTEQRGQLEQRYGGGARFQFRVVVEDGRAKLKASRRRG